MEEGKLPRDEFSTLRRGLLDNPGAQNVRSLVDITDFYGRLETWTVETFRVDGQTTAFLQRVTADGALRLVLPPEVMKVFVRQDGQLVFKGRQASAQKAIATRVARGDKLGNPEALAQARRKRAKGRR